MSSLVSFKVHVIPLRSTNVITEEQKILYVSGNTFMRSYLTLCGEQISYCFRMALVAGDCHLLIQVTNFTHFSVDAGFYIRRVS